MGMVRRGFGWVLFEGGAWKPRKHQLQHTNRHTSYG